MWPSSRTREPIRILGRKELSSSVGGRSVSKWADHGDLAKGEVEKEGSGSASVSIEGRMVRSRLWEWRVGSRREMSESWRQDLLSSLKRVLWTVLLLLSSSSEKTRPRLDEPPLPNIVGFSQKERERDFRVREEEKLRNNNGMWSADSFLGHRNGKDAVCICTISLSQMHIILS